MAFDKRLIGGRVVSIYGTKGGYVSPVFLSEEIQKMLAPGYKVAVVQTTRVAAKPAAKKKTAKR